MIETPTSLHGIYSNQLILCNITHYFSLSSWMVDHHFESVMMSLDFNMKKKMPVNILNVYEFVISNK